MIGPKKLWLPSASTCFVALVYNGTWRPGTANVQDVVQVLDRTMCGLYTYDLDGQYDLVFEQQRTM